MNTNLITADQAAEVLGISVSFVYKLVRARRMPAVKIGSIIRIRREDLDNFINENTTDLNGYEFFKGGSKPRRPIQ